MLKKTIVSVLLVVMCLTASACANKDTQKESIAQVLSLIYTNENSGEIAKLYSEWSAQGSEVDDAAEQTEIVSYLKKQYTSLLSESCFENLMKTRKLSYYSIWKEETGCSITIDSVTLTTRENNQYDVAFNVTISNGAGEQLSFPVTGSAQFEAEANTISYLRLEDEKVYLYTVAE